LKREQTEITAIIDTREQTPLDLEKHGVKSVRGTLAHGDYSLIYPDLRRYLSIERKSLSDFIGCITSERDRFDKELLALRGYQYRFVVCEFRLSDILAHNYRSKVSEDAVFGSLGRWIGYGIPFLFADNAECASYLVAKLLRIRAMDVLEFARAATAIAPELEPAAAIQ